MIERDDRPGALPDGAVLVRTTDVFDNDSVPAGLLRNHRIAKGVWGRLVVHDGILDVVFEDEPEASITVAAGDGLVLPPSVRHRVVLTEPVAFAVEFHRVEIE